MEPTAVSGFDIGILSGFDDSYQIGDTVTVTYVGDTMDPTARKFHIDREKKVQPVPQKIQF